MPAAEGFLELQGVGKDFGAFTAVDGCTLSIAQGEFVTLLGPSGCGKTTTLRMIAGFLQPDRGEIRLAGEVLSSPGANVPPERRDIGMVFQSYAVWPHMSVRQNVELPLKIRHVGKAERSQRVDDVLRLCRLDALADRSPHQLSGGQLQRVALARALVYRPRLILLDEPLSNLDVALREELRREIHRLHEASGATFVLVTHDQVEAMSLSDRVVVMNGGRIEQVGAPHEIYEDPRTDFVASFVGSANLLNGVVRGGEAPGGRRRVAVGGMVMEVRAWEGAVDGQAVTLALHPEGVRVGDQPGRGDQVFDGVVRAAYFLGRTQEVIVALGDVELRAVLVRGRKFVAGEAVRVSVDPEVAIPIGRKLDARVTDVREKRLA